MSRVKSLRIQDQKRHLQTISTSRGLSDDCVSFNSEHNHTDLFSEFLRN